MFARLANIDAFYIELFTAWMRCTPDDFANADITAAVYVPNFLDSLY